MDAATHLDWLEHESAAYAVLLADSDLTVPVPSCPDWDLAALTAHLGGIHRWAGGRVRGVKPEPDPAPAERAALREWFAAGADDLLATLRTTAPDAACWTLYPPATAAFWMRRQAHETAMHRWDAELATGRQPTIDPALAADGVAEIVQMFLPRQLQLGRMAPQPGLIRLDIGDESGLLLSGDGDPTPRSPDATVSGSAETLLLVLWKRIEFEGAELSLTGDEAVVHRLLAAPITP